jgi:hypothetical protein
MSETNEHDPDFHDGYVGISREELEAMPDSELAQWQSNQKKGTPKHTLAEREWRRRMISHQLKEQFNLDAQLAKAAELHAERLSTVNRWWSIAAAIVGVIGALLGTVLGKYLESKDRPVVAQQEQTPTLHPLSQPPISPNSATSPAASSSEATKKAP